jgi:gliding motility-associated-like protein
MLRLLISFFVGCLFVQLAAQTSDPALYVRTAIQGTGRTCSSDAGNIASFGPLTGESNDFLGDTIFLCLNDSIFVNHADDENLSGDPNPSSPGGIGYAFFECPPTANVMMAQDVRDDPCVLDEGMPINGFYVYTGFSLGGDATFFNSGDLQAQFFSGSPGIIHFAPITFDSLADGRFATYEGSPEGACVSMSNDQQFAVAYLNGIDITDFSDRGCDGSFRVQGGLPELNGSDYSSIVIQNLADPMITATITSGSISHNGLVTFTVPEAGDYRILIEDGKSCGYVGTVEMDGCGAVTFELPLGTILPGANKCFPVTVENWVAISAAQFSINWDPSILRVTGIQSQNPDLVAIGGIIISTNANAPAVPPGQMAVSWGDLTGQNTVTLPDGAVLFEICFDAVGVLDECTALTITGNPTPIEVGDPNTGVILDVSQREGKITISQDPFFVLLSQDSVSCADRTDGSFTVLVDEGTAPYRFNWNTVPLSGPNRGPVVIGEDGGSGSVMGLAAGSYQVTITDSGTPQLEVIDTIAVLAGPALGTDISFDSPSCFGANDGVVRAEVFLNSVLVPNPGPEYTYLWNVIGANGQELTGRSAGFYAVTITDANGCPAMASGTVTQPARLEVLTSNTFITDASCSGGENGEITITPTGGTTADGNYDFEWNTGLTTRAQSATLTNLNPGQYCVTVTDDNDCPFERCYNVGAIKTLSIVSILEDVSCNGGDDGEIFVSGSTSGAPADEPYTFSWDTFNTPPTSTPTTSTISDLSVGTYIVTMMDADPAGCMVADTLMVSQPDSLAVSLLDRTDETCIVGNDGSITIAVIGGTGPYTYSWSHDMMLTDSIADGLSAGSYTVQVTDANNCLDMLTEVVSAPDPPVVTQLEDDSVSCPDDTDGALQVFAVPPSAGVTITSYAWSNGGTTPNIQNLSPGQYIVTITASNSCVTVDTAFVTAPDPIMLTDTVVRPPSCPEETDAQIAVIVSGGTAPYIYNWNPGGSGANLNPLTGLGAGTYELGILDANNCAMSPTVSIVVEDPPSIVAANIGDNGFTNVLPTRCPDDNSCDGQATFTAVYSDGSTGVFTYQWSSGEEDINVASSTATALCEGANTVLATDGVCGTIFDFTVAAPEPISPNVMIEPISCAGDNDGSIAITTTGGTAPYDYFWIENSATTSQITDLEAGSYTAVITDANSCIFTQTASVPEPDTLRLTVDPFQSTGVVTCAGDEDGLITVVASGGNANAANPYSYLWSNGVSTPENGDLAAGTYSVTVIDFKGCRDELDFTILEPDPVQFTLGPITPPLCFGDPALITIDTAFGGANNAFEEYVFMIDNNGLRIPVIEAATTFAGDHTVTVEDINGCPAETMINIPSPGQITLSIPGPVVIELGDSLTQLQPVVTPSGNYRYQWSPADFLSADTVRAPFVFPEGSLEYNLVVTNENGCTAAASVFVELDANRNVYIPNIFSPDGDGRNDDFQVFACRGVRAVRSIRLFDRWGGLLVERTGLDPDCLNGSIAWDGRGVNGEEMPSGVYVYMVEIEFLDGIILTYRGDVTLIR